jgi:hypothetical protein
MIAHHAISTVGAKQSSPARKRWDNAYENLRSAVGAALTHELLHFSIPTSRSANLRVSVSLSSLNLSWSPN